MSVSPIILSDFFLFLCRNCVTESKKGWNILMYAIYYRRKKVVKFLVSNTNFHRDGVAGLSLLNLAVLSSDLSIVEMLYPVISIIL